jgi:ketosteroid isomerase-like protein
VTRADAETAEQLRGLAAAYASAVDRRDGPALGQVFAADATLTVHDVATGVERSRSGRAEIEAIAQAIAHYAATFHLVGQSRYEVGPDADRATGEVYCEAHHHIGDLGAKATDHVMHIRYRDAYRRQDETWRIIERVVEVQWTTELPIPARPPGGAAR